MSLVVLVSTSEGNTQGFTVGRGSLLLQDTILNGNVKCSAQ